MARIQDGTFKNWQDGEIIHAAEYKQEREILRAASNDMHENIFDQSIKVENIRVSTGSFQEQLNQIVTTGDSSFESAQARVDYLGNPYSTLKDRLDAGESRVTDLFYNVKYFGAIGDGEADDTEAMQSAFDFAKNGKGSVFIPQGVYKIYSTLEIPDGVRVEGRSTSGTVLEFYGTGDCLTFEYSGRTSVLESLSVINATGTKTGRVGVRLQANLFTTMKDVYIRDFEKGLVIDGMDQWCATNYFYNLHTLRCDIGVELTAADDQKQSNHNLFFGGYIVGEIPIQSGTIGVYLTHGDSNRFYGTAVEDYDIGFHFVSPNPGGNSATNPRVENCNTAYKIDAWTYTNLIDPFGEPIENNSKVALVLTGQPKFIADDLEYSNDVGIKMYDPYGTLWETIKVDPDTNIVATIPSYFEGSFIFQVPDSNNVHRDELVVNTEEVAIRKFLKIGTHWELPTADASMRGRMLMIEGDSNVADAIYICRQIVGGTYEWTKIHV